MKRSVYGFCFVALALFALSVLMGASRSCDVPRPADCSDEALSQQCQDKGAGSCKAGSYTDQALGGMRKCECEGGAAIAFLACME